VELLMASISGRDYSHYFLALLPPLSLLTALLVTELETIAGVSPQWLGITRHKAIALVAIALVLPAVSAVAIELRDRGLPRTYLTRMGPVIEYIQQQTKPHDSIFVWGHAAALYFFADRTPASRYIYLLPLLTPGYADAALIHGFIDELRMAAPTLIVDATAGEDVVPSLTQWDAEWRFPDPRNPKFSYWREGSYWTMTPALHQFYEFVDKHYAFVQTVGPLKWRVYRLQSSRPLAE
jgi:hypothetical protein